MGWQEPKEIPGTLGIIPQYPVCLLVLSHDSISKSDNDHSPCPELFLWLFNSDTVFNFVKSQYLVLFIYPCLFVLRFHSIALLTHGQASLVIPTISLNANKIEQVG